MKLICTEDFCEYLGNGKVISFAKNKIYDTDDNGVYTADNGHYYCLLVPGRVEHFQEFTSFLADNVVSTASEDKPMTKYEKLILYNQLAIMLALENLVDGANKRFLDDQCGKILDVTGESLADKIVKN